MIIRELDLKSTPFCDTQIITYEIELPRSGKKVGFNLLDDEDFKITYITDKIPNSPAGHKIPTQANKNVWIIDINGGYHITAQCELAELNHHKTTRGKAKVNINILRRKSYQRTDLKDLLSRFD